MVVKERSKESKAKEHEAKEKLITHIKVAIQCPDCPNILVLRKNGNCFCESCYREFSEDEIRTRCGI